MTMTTMTKKQTTPYTKTKQDSSRKNTKDPTNPTSNPSDDNNNYNDKPC